MFQSIFFSETKSSSNIPSNKTANNSQQNKNKKTKTKNKNKNRHERRKKEKKLTIKKKTKERKMIDHQVITHRLKKKVHSNPGFNTPPNQFKPKRKHLTS
jgi:hypothetical protein